MFVLVDGLACTEDTADTVGFAAAAATGAAPEWVSG